MLDVFKRIYVGNKLKILILVILTVSISIMNVLIPFLNGKFVDSLVMGNRNIIPKIIIAIIILGFTNIFFRYVNEIISSKLTVGSIFNFRHDVLRHLRRISILKYKKFDPIYLNERTRKDLSEVVNFIVANFVNRK